MAQSVAKKLEPIMSQVPKRGRPAKFFRCLEPLCGQTWHGAGNACLIHPRGRKEEIPGKNNVKVRRRILYVTFELSCLLTVYTNYRLHGQMENLPP